MVGEKEGELKKRDGKTCSEAINIMEQHCTINEAQGSVNLNGHYQSFETDSRKFVPIKCVRIDYWILAWYPLKLPFAFYGCCPFMPSLNCSFKNDPKEPLKYLR